jgi:hypothetical protein
MLKMLVFALLAITACSVTVDQPHPSDDPCYWEQQTQVADWDHCPADFLANADPLTPITYHFTGCVGLYSYAKGDRLYECALDVSGYAKPLDGGR